MMIIKVATDATVTTITTTFLSSSGLFELNCVSEGVVVLTFSVAAIASVIVDVLMLTDVIGACVFGANPAIGS